MFKVLNTSQEEGKKTYPNLWSSFVLILFILACIALVVYATTTDGPKSPGTNAEDSSIGTVSWSHPDYDQISDDNYATSQGNMNDGEATVYLKATNFGFLIPDGATIDGISVNVERKASDTSFFDNAIRIVKDGTIWTTDKSSDVAWPISDSTITYGSASDLWGQTWTAADINNANFGFAISVKKVGGNNNEKPSIDYINVVVTYTLFDAIPPSTPGTPSTISPTNNNKPTWCWAASTDSGSGLADPAYSAQWCDNPDFTGCDANISTSDTNSFTHLSSLANLTYYFRVKAADVAGNHSDYSPNGSVLVDTTAPSVPGIPQALIGTNLTSQVWTWAASTDTGSGVKQYDWQVDGGPGGTTTDTTVTTNLTEGNWKFYVKAEDNAGNQSAENSSILAVLVSSIHQVVVDCTVPLVQIVTVNGVSNPSLDLSPITAASEDLLVANVNCVITLKSLLPSATVMVDIPAGAVIKGPPTVWSKVIIPPVAVTPSTNLLPANSQVALAILFGHNVAPLEVTRGLEFS